MKESNLSLTEIFCEVLSGLALIGTVAPLFDIMEVYCLSQTWSYVKSNVSISNTIILVIASYVLGLIVDAVGLAIGELFLDDLICSKPSDTMNAEFWKKVQPHVLSYQDRQWAYYSCYRNLLILLPFAFGLWSIVILKYSGGIYWLMCLGVFLILGVAFYFSMRSLLRIYYEIRRRF